MAVYYNRFRYGRKYAGARALSTSSNSVIAYSAGPIPDINLRSGLTLNNTASASAAVSAVEDSNPSGG